MLMILFPLHYLRRWLINVVNASLSMLSVSASLFSVFWEIAWFWPLPLLDVYYLLVLDYTSKSWQLYLKLEKTHFEDFSFSHTNTHTHANRQMEREKERALTSLHRWKARFVIRRECRLPMTTVARWPCWSDFIDWGSWKMWLTMNTKICFLKTRFKKCKNTNNWNYISLCGLSLLGLVLIWWRYILQAVSFFSSPWGM